MAIKKTTTKITTKKPSTKSATSVKSAFSKAIGSVGSALKSVGNFSANTGLSAAYNLAKDINNQYSYNNPQNYQPIPTANEKQKQTEDIKESTTSYMPNYMDDINSQFQQRRAAAIARIESARDGSLSNLEREREGIRPRYANLKAEWLLHELGQLL